MIRKLVLLSAATALLIGAAPVRLALAAPPVPIHCIVVALPQIAAESNEDEGADPLDTALGLADPAEGPPTLCVHDQSLAWAIATSNPTQAVIAVHYEKYGYRGSTLTVTSSIEGCSTGKSWELAQMPTAWNNEIESTKNYTGCNIVRHFDYKLFRGEQQDCSPCDTLFFMNNRTSSVKYKP